MFQPFFIRALASSVAMLLVVASAIGAETNVVPANPSVPGGTTGVFVGTNYFQQFHEDLLTSLRAAEKARVDAEAAAKRNEEFMAARLNFIEQSLRTRSDHEMETIKTWNQFMITIVSILGGIGVLGILFAALLLSRASNHVAAMAAAFQTNPSLLAGHAASALGAGDMHLGRANLAEQSNASVLGAIERIQKQIDDLERLARVPSIAITKGCAVESKEIPAASERRYTSEPSPEFARASKGEKIELLLGKAQALIHLNQAETALTCFDEVLALDADNLDALVKRGAALERLGRVDEAIESYDRAIALNHSLTTAYLLKGGAFNQLGRHKEAVQCFEQALRAQEKTNIN